MQHFTGTLIFDPDHPEFTISMSLGAGGGIGFSEFSHTAGITFDLPRGVSYTSDSGVFLAGDATDVPEPAPLALAALGFGLTWAVRRRARVTA